MKEKNVMKWQVVSSMPKKKEHWPLAICFALSFVVMMICCCGGSWLAVPFGVLTLILSKRMEKAGVDIEE